VRHAAAPHTSTLPPTFSVSFDTRMPVTITLPAAQTAYLHAAKHADCAVFGLLLGGSDGCLEQAVPVCHLNVGCSPVVEAACVVVDALCKGKCVRIVGCYYAAMGMAEVADLKEPKHKVLQSLAAALMPAHGFTVCLVFSNANSGNALSVPPPLQSPAPPLTSAAAVRVPPALHRMDPAGG
jgi:hypothetical protein